MRLSTALLLGLLGCDSGSTTLEPTDGAPDGPAAADAGPEADAWVRRPNDATAPDAGRPVDRALILDLEMRDPLSWGLVRSILEGQGYAVTYRRGFAHFTSADADRYQLVVLAAGTAPGGPTDWIREAELPRLAGFVRAGGTVVLASRNGWRDGLKANFDTTAFNALLGDHLGLGLRIDRNTMVGDVALPAPPKPPLHQTVPWGYVGPLEWTLQLPVAFPAAEAALESDAPFAAGWVPALACDDDQVTVLARSHADAIVWWQLDGADADRIDLPGEPQPLAAVVAAGAGWVATMPRSFLDLTTLPADGGARPSLEPALYNDSVAFARAAFDRIDDLRRGVGIHLPGGCTGGREPAAVDAERALDRPDAPLPDAPPELPGWARPSPGVAAETAVPDWFRGGKVRAAYGDLRGVAEMRDHFADARGAAIDLVVSSTGDGAIRAYTEGTTPPFIEPVGDATGFRWFLGSFYRNGVFTEGDHARSVDAYGRAFDAPSPLDPTWWAEGVAPIIEGAARIAASHPNLAGVSLDTELYGTGPLMYAAGHGYEPPAWATVVAAIRAHDPGLADEAEASALRDRLPWLVTHGLAPFAWRALEAEVAARATEIREAARAIAPELELAVYLPYVRTSWFYRGLMRGWGTAERPLLVLSYDPLPAPVRDQLAGQGVHVRTLGGVLAVRLTADDLGTALHTAGARSDGFWLFQYRDFGRDTDPAERHDPVEAYWDAVRAAGERLE